jgi:hypothetical protein
VNLSGPDNMSKSISHLQNFSFEEAFLKPRRWNDKVDAHRVGQQQTLRVVRTMYQSPSTPDIATIEPIWPVLTFALQSNDPALVYHATLALKHMVLDEDNAVIDAVQRSGQTENVVGLLTHDAKRVRMTALEVVEHLMNSDNQEVVLEAARSNGGNYLVRQLLSVLRDRDAKHRHVLSSCRSVAGMAECNSDVIKFLVDGRAFDALAMLHTRGVDHATLELIIFTLCMATRGATPAQLTHVLTTRTAGVFVDTMTYLTTLKDGASLRVILKALTTVRKKWEPHRRAALERIFREDGLGLSVKMLTTCGIDSQVKTIATKWMEG